MQGKKTHEQLLRMVERKPDVPDARQMDAILGSGEPAGRLPRREEDADDRYPVSPQGAHQERRDHNKHNNPGQSGHRPQTHSPAEEKS